MAENNPVTPPDGVHGNTPDGGSSSDEQTVSRSELQKVIGERDTAKQRVKGLEGKLNELQAQLDDLSKKSGRSKDEEATLDSLKHKLEGIEKERNEFRKRYEDSIVDRQLWPLANEHIRQGDADLFIQLNRERFEVYNDVLDGSPKVRVKGSGQTLKEFVESFCNERPTWAANKRAKGSDAQGPNSGEASPAGVPSDFSTWPKDKRTEFFKKNPDLATKIVQGLVR